MTVGLVIFSRMDSQRLPGKAMLSFAGRALLGHVIDRACAARAADMVIVATSDRPTDDAIAEFAAAEGVQVFRGSAEDVFGRALACAEACRLTLLGRICGDSPFIDPRLIDRVIQVHLEKSVDLTTNLHPRTFPAGMSFEAIDIEAMRRIEGLTDDPGHREHVTSYIYENPGKFLIHNITSGINGHDETPLTVDTVEDLVQANWLARRLGETDGAWDMDAVLALARQWRRMNPVDKERNR